MAEFLSGWKSKTLLKDAPMPKQPDHKPQLIVNRFCPFARRAILTAAIKHIPVEVVNIGLGPVKPPWYPEKCNPLGSVPTLILPNGKKIWGSEYVCEYLDSEHGSKRLFCHQPMERANQRMRLELMNRFCNAFGMVLHHPGGIMATSDQFTKALVDLAELLGDQPYFGGAELRFEDIFIYGFIEPLEAFEKIEPCLKISETLSQHPNITKWLTRVQDIPEIKSIAYPTDLHRRFTETQIKKQPDYDLW